MAQVLIVSQDAKMLINFRGDFIKALADLGHNVIVLGPHYESDYRRLIAEHGASYKKITLDRTGVNPFKDILSFFMIYKAIKKTKPDIVYSYNLKPVIYGSLAAAYAGVHKIYSMIPGLGFVFIDSNGAKRKILQIVVKLLLRVSLQKNNAIFVLNNDDYNFFKHNLLKGKDVRIILTYGEGVNLRKFYFTQPIINPFSFLLIARILRDKGIFEYVKAAQILKKRYPDVNFKLIGPLDSNPSAVKLKELEYWIKEGYVEYLGEVSDVRPYIAGCSVYVLPSYYREGMPRTILEAMAMGRPIITTDVPGCRETVDDGFNGFKVKVKDVSSLVEAMEKFILNPSLVKTMGERSRQIAEERYDVDKVNGIILQELGLLDVSLIGKVIHFSEAVNNKNIY